MSFDADSYQVSENEGSVSVCVTTEDIIAQGFSVAVATQDLQADGTLIICVSYYHLKRYSLIFQLAVIMCKSLHH